MKKGAILVLTMALAAAMALPMYAGNHGRHNQGGAVQQAADVGVDGATQAALADAGFAADDVSIVHTSHYYKQGSWVYKVVFHTGDTAHIYEINAGTGGVYAHYTHPVDHNWNGTPDGTTEQAADSSYISEAEARTIVLAHAGVPEVNLTRYESKMKSKSNRMVYDIQFRTSSDKYEYRIDASTGEIIEWEVK